MISSRDDGTVQDNIKLPDILLQADRGMESYHISAFYFFECAVKGSRFSWCLWHALFMHSLHGQDHRNKSCQNGGGMDAVFTHLAFSPQIDRV